MGISLRWYNLRNGSMLACAPENNGVYVKTLTTTSGGTMALFPTTVGLSVFDGSVFGTEIKFTMHKTVHPDYVAQRRNTEALIYSTGAEKAYTTNLRNGTANVAYVDECGIHLDDGPAMIAREDYDIFNRNAQLDADAIVTDLRHVAIVMYAADCPTAFIIDRRTGAIGVLHSMWRGLVVEKNGKVTSIVRETIDCMKRRYGTDPNDLEVSIFPCIGIDAFCVGEEVSKAFRDRGLGRFVLRGEGNAQDHIDLRAAIAYEFTLCGVPEKRISVTPYETGHYGLNSLRWAPTSSNVRALTDDVVSENVGVPAITAKLHTDAENERSTVRSSTLNILIAMRYR